MSASKRSSVKQYVLDKIGGEPGSVLLEQVALFQALRVFHPTTFLNLYGPNGGGITEEFLRTALPFLGYDLPSEMSERDREAAVARRARQPADEMNAYATAARDYRPGDDEPDDLIEWWRRNARVLPHWSAAARLAMLYQPSSAMVERIFSILNNKYKDSQSRILEGHLIASVMCSYNTMWRAKYND